MNAVDTKVFVYAFDADEAVKRPKAEELLDELAQQSRLSSRNRQYFLLFTERNLRCPECHCLKA
jgi:predicted nucleic acid-binding protein